MTDEMGQGATEVVTAADGGASSSTTANEGGENNLNPNSVLQFAPWQSTVEEGFWRKLANLKLNELGISQHPIEITGFYAPSSHGQVSNHLKLLSESLLPHNGEETSASVYFLGNRNLCPVPGILHNTNTLESFKALDRQTQLNLEAKKIWEDIHSGRAEEDSSLLCRFLLISFVDLKKWNFYYWFAFPALVLDPPATFSKLQRASDFFSFEERKALLAACNGWRQSEATTGVPFFLVHIFSNVDVRLRPLNEWETCQEEGGKVLLGFYDPCHLPSNPGWPLRNLIAFAAARWGLGSVTVLCYREKGGLGDLQQSLVADISVSSTQGWSDPQSVPKAVGWERNNQSKMGPRRISLASQMDPKRLAISAADLNLKLMRWRLLPSLNLPLLSSTKCLLLGAGTLGCQVARNLMAWGIRHITLVDYGRVAMSNPVRQSLYTLDDSLNGGELKAFTAAKNLKCIFPGVEAEGISMAIPMPGHPVAEDEIENIVKDCLHLKDLIVSHDFVFLLTDTRESRWLPTLLCADANKVAITAALGFDTFLVMRHGAGIALPSTDSSPACSDEETNSPQIEHDEPSELMDLSIFEETERRKQRLGCYYCSDIVAPVDSTRNLTLDQQCTVTRPGLAPIVASLAVELTVGIIHHPLGINASADQTASDISSVEQPLGILPHQIRGDIAKFSQVIFKGRAFNRCTACSETVVSEYRKRGMDFILEALNQPSYLEDLTGLTTLMDLANNFNLDLEDSDDDLDDNVQTLM
ncbi:hypothetical protein SUGI_1027260 [Cryptomeria japonica]|uniref:ubiquitin-like modifier-activating enzyme atg7 n=1 Tax=Cryptomeria japonica TaxID=3369 RepID=UPI002414CBDB|nr:ubiquitin-like modifier-activating enzyme atg7 [Cryptomeria japonica]GLJ48709.1 hypothetical protein SUGI_1027260 [Cryptomeria japonica]